MNTAIQLHTTYQYHTTWTWNSQQKRRYPQPPLPGCFSSKKRGVLRELRQQSLEKRPKLGAYQRWVRELDVAEGDATELLGWIFCYPKQREFHRDSQGKKEN